MAIKPIKNNFNKGELSPQMDARTDLTHYYNGCATMSNAIPIATGGFIARPGSQYIAKAKSACNLVPFEFSAADTMILEMGNLYIRFYKDDDRVMVDSVTIIGITLPSGSEVSVEATTHLLTTGDVVRFTSVGGTTELNYLGLNTEFTITKTDANNFTLDGTDGDDYTAWTAGGTVAAIYEIATPYSASEVFELMVARSGDVFRITHEDYEPRKLTRVADNSWTIAAVTFTDGPFQAGNTTSTSLMETEKASAGTHTGANNAAVMTDSAASFIADNLIGLTIYNVTDGSSTTITDNDTTTITGILSGGTDDDWDTGDEYYIYDPYYIKAGTTGLTLTASGSGNTPFVAAHVGTKFLMEHTRGDNTTSTKGESIKVKGNFNFVCENFTAGADTVVLRRKVGSAANATKQIVRTFHAASSYSGTEDEDDVTYDFGILVDADSSVQATLTAEDQIHRSIVECTAFVSSTVLTVTAVTDVYFDKDVATNRTDFWAIGSWGETTGFPRAVTFHEDRVFYGGTTKQPQTIWGSRTASYDNLTPGTDDSDALTLIINDVDVSEIEWLASHKSLAVGTANKEYLISASDVRNPITPDDAKSVIQSTHGSLHIQPVSLNDSLFHVQRPGRRIRYMNLNEYGDRLTSTDATLLAQHLFELNPISMATQRTPEPVLWVARTDGTMCVFAFNPQEEVSGWSRLVTGSFLDSPTDKYTAVAVISGTIEDNVWAVVNRTINSSSVYYIEKFSTRYIDQLDEAMMLDSAKVVDGTYDSKDINVASDTVRCNNGLCNSGPCGGVVV